MEVPTVVRKLATFTVKTYIPFLRDACAYYLSTRMTACRRKICLQSVGRWLCSNVSFSDCRCGELSLIVYISDVLLLGPAFCSSLVVAVRLSMFELRNLGSGHSKGASRRM